MDKDELREKWISYVTAMAEQWQNVDRLIETGELSPRSRGWFEVNGAETLGKIDKIARTTKFDDKRNTVHVKLSKPRKKLLAMAERLTRK